MNDTGTPSGDENERAVSADSPPDPADPGDATSAQNDSAAPPHATLTPSINQRRTQRYRRGMLWVTGIVLLVLAGSALKLGLAYTLWHEYGAQQAITTRVLTTVRAQMAVLTQNQTNQTQALKADANRQAALDDQLTSLRDQQQVLRDQQLNLTDMLRGLHSEVRTRNGTSQVLAEVEFLMRSAQYHLMLDRDVPTALAALSAADQRLQGATDPDALHVRSLLAADITRLLALKQSDIASLALTLTSIISAVDTLPLAARTPGVRGTVSMSHPDATNPWLNMVSRLVDTLKSLVVIHYSTKNVQPLVPPAQDYFLVQNLRLELEAARMALLRRDAPLFHSILGTAQAWLKTWFDARAPATRQFAETLTKLAGEDINPPLPDISGSLRTVAELLADEHSAAPALPAGNRQPAKP